MKNEEFENSTRNQLIRMNLKKYHYDKLIDILNASDDVDATEVIRAIQKKKTIVKDLNTNKLTAMETATEARTSKAKAKIKEAVAYIKRFDEKLTQKNIADKSGCSVNTVKKYDNIWK